VLEHIELLWIARLELAHEAFDGAVLVSEPVFLDQVLINRLSVAPKTQLRLDPFPVRLADRSGRIVGRGAHGRQSRSFYNCDFHFRGRSRLARLFPDVGADCLTVHTRRAGDLAQAPASLQQCFHRGS
jgi:hypothetical protein